MDGTPEKASRGEDGSFAIAVDGSRSPRRSSRIKKPPPITPRRFTRFFTPRPKNVLQKVKTSRAALREVSAASLNSRISQPFASPSSLNTENARPSKKRKLSFTSAVSSIQSSPIRRVDFLSSSQETPDAEPARIDEEDIPYISDDEQESDLDEPDAHTEDARAISAPVIRPYRTFGISAGLLSTRLSGRKVLRVHDGSGLWQSETADFFSCASDVNTDTAPGSAYLALPFTTTSCKTNPIVAVGDEEGCVRLLDSANDSSFGFEKTYLLMKPHDNAIMDLEFSHNDKYLATASGDQTCQIIDVENQTICWRLKGHTSSVRRIQFQPGTAANIIATSAPTPHQSTALP